MILGKGSYTKTNEFENVDFNISTEACGYTSIISDTTEEIASLESALYIADIMLEQKVLEGATEDELETALEGVMSSMYERLKSIIKKLIAKIKQWFENIKKFFQILFSHGKDFAKKYKTDIVKAAARCNGYKYKVYDIVGGWKTLLEYAVVDKSGREVAFNDAMKAAREVMEANKNETSTAELTKIHMQKVIWRDSSDSQAEFNKDFREKLLNGNDSKEEYEDFKEGPSVYDMLNLLENGQKVISKLETAQKNMTSLCNNVLRDIEAAEKKSVNRIVDKGEGELSKIFTVATDICKASANHCIAVLDIQKEVLKTCMKDAETVLKGLLRHKPKTESFAGDFEDGSESILESAFRCL